METYLFYITHLIMITCFLTIISTGWAEHMHTIFKNVSELISGISPLKKPKAIYRLINQERTCFKSLLVNMLYIGMQISNQLIK
jgi:hypothetical protein